MNAKRSGAALVRSLEDTAAGLRFKPPKAGHERCAIKLPANVIETLRAHRRQQAEERLLLGLGRPGAADLVVTLADKSPYPPDKLSRDWGNVVRDRGPPRVKFHGLRHSHASALIANGLDVVTVSRRLGHSSPAITLGVYAHARRLRRDGHGGGQRDGGCHYWTAPPNRTLGPCWVHEQFPFA